MHIEVSIGEAIDKYSILELKAKYITNPEKLASIHRELQGLSECYRYIHSNPFFYKLLLHINDEIWKMTDKIKNKDVCYFERDFAYISNMIFEYNQKRFRLKSIFNNLYNSNFIEQKSYAESHCKILVRDETTLLNKIAEINYIAIDYDTISFDTTPELLNIIKSIFKNTNIVYTHTSDIIHTIDLNTYIFPHGVSREHYYF